MVARLRQLVEAGRAGREGSHFPQEATAAEGPEAGDYSEREKHFWPGGWRTEGQRGVAHMSHQVEGWAAGRGTGGQEPGEPRRGPDSDR